MLRRLFARVFRPDQASYIGHAGDPGPEVWERSLLRDRCHLHAETMPIECVREMNAVFERHFGVAPIRNRHNPYVDDD